MTTETNTDATRKFAESLVRTLVDHGFIHGWFGDKSADFLSSEVESFVNIFHGRHKISLCVLTSHAGNLSHYCGWSASQVLEFIHRCGYTTDEKDGQVFILDKNDANKPFRLYLAVAHQ